MEISVKKRILKAEPRYLASLPLDCHTDVKSICWERRFFMTRKYDL